MIESRGIFKAVPLDVSDPAKLAYILARLVEHESEWTDFQKDAELRTRIAAKYLYDAVRGEIAILEVWDLRGEASLVGLLGFTKIVPKVDAQFHPVFFDGKLRNAAGKRDLLLRAMDWAFGVYDLHRLSVVLPENRYALVSFVRQKLGFRFEGENRTIKQQRVRPHGHLKTRDLVALTPSWRGAEWGSRKYQAAYVDGRWLDLLLLSVTRDEFAQFVRTPCPSSSTDPTPSNTPPAT